MKKENLAIITNEKTYLSEKKYFCDNIDAKSIPEGLNSDFDVRLYVRKSKIERKSHEINLKKIVVSNGLISYIFNILRLIKIDSKYLIISLSPYTFIIYLFLLIFRKKVFVYLRSDGYEEYKCYSKLFGPTIYHIMFIVASWGSNLIACRSHILKGKKGAVVSPSQLNEKWFLNRKTPNLKNINLLYVGRIKIEKGVLSLIKILNKVKLDFKFSIINSETLHDKKLENAKIRIRNFQNRDDSIIGIYDDHNIFILPSYTEGHPQVLDESLSRLRPVIIFPEISHTKRNREGVFLTERSSESLSKQIEYIMKNYEAIQKKIFENKLPKKEDFLRQILEIVKSN